MDTTACDLFLRCITRRQNDDWHELTRRYGSRIRTLVWRALVRHQVRPAAQEIEEHVQELYLRLLILDGSSFRGRTEKELWRYLARMAHNLVADRRRGGEAERRVLEALHEGDSRRRSNHLGATPEPSPESRAMARQHLAFFLERCRKAVYVGPSHQLQLALKLRVIRLAFLDGCSSREIARVLRGRMTPRQIDSFVFRLRQRLARLGVEVARRRGHGFPDPLTSVDSFVHR